MARNLHVYPKAVLADGNWVLIVKVFDQDLRTTTRWTETTPAGVTVTNRLRLLKMSFDLVVADTDTDQDVFEAFTVDDIRAGPQVETVWGNWVDRAEANIVGDPTLVEFMAVWSTQDTSKTRADARKALVTQRGWTVSGVHQHEGDGTILDE